MGGSGSGGGGGPTCQPTKELKETCRFDAECASVRQKFSFPIEFLFL